MLSGQWRRSQFAWKSGETKGDSKGLGRGRMWEESETGLFSRK